MARRRILVVEPDEELRDQTVQLLDAMRAEILHAADGNQALVAIETGEPDLILCSHELGGHSAQELCDYVHEFSSGYVPFLLVVPQDEKEPRRIRREVGADVVLQRPLDPTQLNQVLGLLLQVGGLKERIGHLQEENLSLRRELRDKLHQDPDTKFYRFDLFKKVILMEVKKAKRYGFPVAILLLTFDHYQELAGWLSPSLRSDLFDQMRKVVTDSTRDIDIPLMFADDKVMVVMPHTGLRSGVVVADRIRETISAIKPPASLAQLVISVSLAVASTEGDDRVSFGKMVQQTMRGLAEADLKGGNVVIACPARTRDGRPACEVETDGKLGPRTYFV